MSDSGGWLAREVSGRPPSAVEFVLGDLAEAITHGELRVGDRLPSEAALATRYSVSRAVIREALRSCEARGLTVTRTGRGTFVVANRPAGLVFEGRSAVHLMEARPGVEIPAAALAALRRTEEQLAGLWRLIEAMEQEGDVEVWTRLDASFHLLVAQASGNPVFAEVIASIASALSQQSQMLNVQLGRRTASQAEHRAITAAIARGSGAEAEDAMRYHLDEVRDALAASMTTP